MQNYKPGDVIIVDGNAEYVCVKKIENGYILTKDETPVAGKEYYTKSLDANKQPKYSKVVNLPEDSIPKDLEYYEYKENIERLYWEEFGDPDGLTELAGTVKTIGDAVSTI
jgi:hypothetical protein